MVRDGEVKVQGDVAVMVARHQRGAVFRPAGQLPAHAVGGRRHRDAATPPLQLPHAHAAALIHAHRRHVAGICLTQPAGSRTPSEIHTAKPPLIGQSRLTWLHNCSEWTDHIQTYVEIGVGTQVNNIERTSE